MPLTESVRLDVDQAEAAIARLKRDVETLGGTRTLDIDIEVDERPLRTIDERLDSIEANVADVNRDVSDIAVSAGRATDEFQQMAQALGVSETEARQLADEILTADRAARQIDDSARAVARELGLADDDARRFANEMGRASRETRETDAAMGRLAAGAARMRVAIIGAVAAFGVRGLVNQAGEAIESFNLLNESVNAVEVTFEEGSDAVFDFGENVARTAGLARGEFQQAVVPIGALLRNFGFDADQAGNAAVTLTQRAADLASVFNTDVNEALEAIAAGLRGEANPLERFGAGLSAARVEAKALELGLAATKAEITDLDKVTARYQLILEDTARAQGDFARTADSPANAARILAAEAENARAVIGESLIPAYQQLLQIGPELVASIEELGPAIGAVAEAAVQAAPGVVGFLERALDLADRLTRQLQLDEVRDDLIALGDVGGVLLFDEIVAEFNDMVDAIEAGTRPADALRTALLAFEGPLELTGSAIEIFARRAGLAGDELRDFLISLSASPQAQLFFTEQELRALANTIAILTNESGGAEAEWNRFQSALARSQVSAAVADVDDGIVTLRELQDAAREAGVTIQEALGSDLFEAGTIFDVFAQAEVQVANFRDRVNEIGREIDPLKGATEQLDISRREFIANLQEAFEQEVGFEANLARLANRGFDALADRLRELGPGAATLAEEFLGNVADATVANDVFDASANRVATGLSDALREEFRGSLFTGLPSELARTLAAAFETDPGTGFDSLAEKQARQINQGLRAPAARSELEAGGRESADEVTSAFAAEVERLAPTVGYDAALDIARALTTGESAAAAEQAGIDWARLFSAAVAANVSFDFQRPPGTFAPPPPAIPQSPTGLGPNVGLPSSAFSINIQNPVVTDLPSSLAQAQQAAETISNLVGAP